jgi:hypothetical protein
MVDPCAKL